MSFVDKKMYMSYSWRANLTKEQRTEYYLAQLKYDKSLHIQIENEKILINELNDVLRKTGYINDKTIITELYNVLDKYSKGFYAYLIDESAFSELQFHLMNGAIINGTYNKD